MHSEVDGEKYLEQLGELIGQEGEELLALLRQVVSSVSTGESTLDFAASNGHASGVSGYTYHTVPVAIHAWLSNPKDVRKAIVSVVECGGDADAVAAIVGGIIGAATGEAEIPKDWLAGIWEWPRTVNWMKQLAKQLSESTSGHAQAKPISLNFVALLMRNLLFLLIVLFHGFRRLLPPY